MVLWRRHPQVIKDLVKLVYFSFLNVDGDLDCLLVAAFALGKVGEWVVPVVVVEGVLLIG